MRRSRGATVVALTGDLGAGKTTFVQGFARGLGARGRSPSPTFVIMRRRALRKGPFKNLFHVDAYRLARPEHLAALEFDRILADPANLVLLEWPERAEGAVPKDAVKVFFVYGKKENERTISIPDARRAGAKK